MKAIWSPILGICVIMWVSTISPYHAFVMFFVVPSILCILTVGTVLYCVNAYETERNMIMRERLFILSQLEEYSEVVDDGQEC